LCVLGSLDFGGFKSMNMLDKARKLETLAALLAEIARLRAEKR
jgi:hypothetical protein